MTASGAILVFGSNLAGRHDAGAALLARERHGAICGQAMGRQGRSYAIPTQDAQRRPLALWEIAAHVVGFVDYARAHPELTFDLTAVGCDTGDYEPDQIARMFAPAPCNVMMPQEFAEQLPGRRCESPASIDVR